MEKPILFNNDMVRAILRGEKRQTRRIIKPQPKARLAWDYFSHRWKYPSQEICDKIPSRFSLARVPQDERGDQWTAPCGFADLLYVREEWLQLPSGKYEYRADYPDRSMWNLARKWHPSIHMPKAAARIWLQVDKVRCQRLNEITEEDACAEVGWDDAVDPLMLYRDRFFDAWRKCYGKASIEENPWVWVIKFYPIKKYRNHKRKGTETMKDILELAECQSKIQKITTDVKADLYDIEDRALEAKQALEDFLERVQTIADALDEEKRAFTRAMFDRFLAAGINVGVEVEIKIDLNKIIRPMPLKIVGICSLGFVYVDADGKEGIFGCGALKILDRVIVKQQ